MNKSNTSLRRWSKLGLLLVICLAFLSEGGLRALGTIDFPTYDTDPQIGYVPRANQAGSFLNQKRWIINDRNMNVATPWQPFAEHDLLLTGDSLVWGGNSFDQPEKLGEQLQSRLPSWKVWPISAGSWSVENVATWLSRNADVVAETDCVVWVLNTGDFSAASQWKTDATHPRATPSSALLYALDKYLLSKFFPPASPDKAEPQSIVNNHSVEVFKAQLQMLADHHAQVVVVLYPDRKQFAHEAAATADYEEFRQALVTALPQTIELMEVRDSSAWSDEFYKDGIHPNPAGNVKLAELIAGHVQDKRP